MNPLTHLKTSSARLKHQLTDVISSVKDMVSSNGTVNVVTPHSDAVFKTLLRPITTGCRELTFSDDVKGGMGSSSASEATAIVEVSM